MKAFGKSDVGRVREKNEDSLLVKPPLFAVADGMGGHAAGEVASQLALQAFAEALPRQDGSWEQRLVKAAQSANEAVYREARRLERLAGMGTTLCAVYVEPGQASWLHVGDSRLYLYRQGRLLQVTTDHSLVWELVQNGSLSAEEARQHPRRNVLTRALGTQETVATDSGTLPLQSDDCLLLCSDGLSGLLEEVQLANLLAASRQEPVEARVEALVAAANAAGGHDNISAILVDVGRVGA